MRFYLSAEISCSLEENLAIIGANLALSRAVFSFFKEGGHFSRRKQAYRHRLPDAPRQHSANQRKENQTLFSSTNDQDIEIPLEEMSPTA